MVIYDLKEFWVVMNGDDVFAICNRESDAEYVVSLSEYHHVVRCGSFDEPATTPTD